MQFVVGVSTLSDDRGKQRGSVLVVDDSIDMRDLLTDVLTAEGWDVRTAASGDRALRLMRERRPDAVIMDLFMPGMSGVELRGMMLRDRTLARIPVVVLSAYWARPEETLEAFAALSKPLSIKRLLSVMGRLAPEDMAQPMPSGQPVLEPPGADAAAGAG
jgi:CheY-like chemotaxis protein